MQSDGDIDHPGHLFRHPCDAITQAFGLTNALKLARRSIPLMAAMDTKRVPIAVGSIHR